MIDLGNGKYFDFVVLGWTMLMSVGVAIPLLAVRDWIRRKL